MIIWRTPWYHQTDEVQILYVILCYWYSTFIHTHSHTQLSLFFKRIAILSMNRFISCIVNCIRNKKKVVLKNVYEWKKVMYLIIANKHYNEWIKRIFSEIKFVSREESEVSGFFVFSHIRMMDYFRLSKGQRIPRRG